MTKNEMSSAGGMVNCGLLASGAAGARARQAPTRYMNMMTPPPQHNLVAEELQPDERLDILFIFATVCFSMDRCCAVSWHYSLSLVITDPLMTAPQ